MKGSFKLLSVFGITIKVHVTFFLLFLLVLPGGVKWIFLVIGIFFFVTLHELTHSLVARRFGIMVREITLLPIGGVASMTKMPEKPVQEFAISLAGPLFNLAVLVIFYYPAKVLLGREVLFSPSTATWPHTIAYVYWINLILAAFNLIPAFPMDGGRVLRSLLAIKLGFHKATRIAVTLGHIFAMAFIYFGFMRGNIILIVIAVFIYIAASNEEMQVEIKEALKKFRISDILSRNFATIESSSTLSQVLELMFHTRQEDFAVMERQKMVGFVTRQDIVSGMHQFGMGKRVSEIMRTDFATAKETDPLTKAQNIMLQNQIRALPVVKGGQVVGVVTFEDIGRVYSMVSQK